MYRFLGTLIIIGIIIFAGCRESNVTPTKGSVIVEVDPAVFPVLQKEQSTFDSLYKHVQVELKQVTPLDGMVNLLNNKSKMFISSRDFNKKELDFISQQKLDIKSFKFCYDAVAVIGSKNNSTNQIRVDEIRDALSGKNNNYSFLIPQNTSSTYQYIKEDILNGMDPKNTDLVANDSVVINKVENNAHILGIVSFNLIQDSSKIKFIRVGQIENGTNQDKDKKLTVNYFTPHPGFVLKNYYPLKQLVYIYLNEITLGPASGFTTFLTSYEGQKIALGQNLAPAAVPVKINE